MVSTIAIYEPPTFFCIANKVVPGIGSDFIILIVFSLLGSPKYNPGPIVDELFESGIIISPDNPLIFKASALLLSFIPLPITRTSLWLPEDILNLLNKIAIKVAN